MENHSRFNAHCGSQVGQNPPDLRSLQLNRHGRFSA
jgi:hypothetical protein